MKVNYYMFTKHMAKWMRDSRGSLNISQDAAGKGIGFDQGFVSKHEREGAQKIQVDKWKKTVAFYTSQGCPAIADEFDPEKTTPAPKEVIRQLKKLKAETGSSWDNLAATLGVAARELAALVGARPLGTDRLILIQQGLTRLAELPTKLVEAGSVSKPKKKTSTALVKVETSTKKAPKRTIIQPANPHVPTLTALRLRELQLVQLLQKDIEMHQLGDILNGHAMSLVRF